jgi:hypothetical protein
MKLTRFSPTLPIFALALLLGMAGCKSNQNASTDQSSQPAATGADQTAAADQGQNPSDPGDPANSNLAPIPASYTAPAQASAPASAPDTSSTPDTSSAANSGSDGDYSDASYNDTPVDYASQPPPSLPDYQQPPIPQPGYIWTPGYWAWAPAGYYWVPGAWTEPPYEGALWTPGYWGFVGGRYGFHSGYWGRYIGFYGGVNYGFGYVGVGYQGGYWHGNNFAYNRSVNNFGSVRITNVYERNVVINRTVVENHVSFNGGPQGIRLRPSPAEVAAYRAPHAPPMRAQVDLARTSAANRAQFVAVNHGRPASFVADRPLAADKGIRPAPAIRPVVVNREGARPGVPNQPHPEARPETRPGAAPVARPEARPETRPEARPEPARPITQPRPEARPETHPAPQPRPESRPAPQSRPAPRPESRPAPAQHPAPHPQNRPAPERPKQEPK